MSNILLNAGKRSFTIIAKGLKTLGTLVNGYSNWIDDTGAYMVDDTGAQIVFNLGETVDPILLQANKRSFSITARKTEME